MRRWVLAFSPLVIAGCGAVTDSATLGKGVDPAETFEGPVPRAVCGPGSQPETDAQGRVPLADKQSGRSAEGYWCNLEHVGHEGDGALWQMAWYEDCAYYGLGVGFATGSTTGFVPGAPDVPAGGVAVVDATDPANPVRTLTLNTPAMMDPWETLKVNEKRGLLAGSSVSLAGSAFDVYDVKRSIAGNDCSTPVLLAASVNGLGHEGEFAPDGLTYYSSGFIAPATQAIDLAEPNAPNIVASINRAIHGLSLNEEGTRLYAAKHGNPNGMEIWDTSAIQLRGNTATSFAVPAKIIGAAYWTDGGTAQMTIPVTIQGKPYVIHIDEGGGGSPSNPGMARIIDISDETNPVVVSKLKDEINMPEYAIARAEDGGAGGFTYQGHYCGVPQREEPGVVGCSYFWQGIRVFDIRDPYHPKEIAYYIPPLTGVTRFASPLNADQLNAHASSAVRFVKARGEVWFTNQNTGFHIVRFTNGVWPFQD